MIYFKISYAYYSSYFMQVGCRLYLVIVR